MDSVINKEENKEQRSELREQVVKETERLFAQKGIKNVTMNDIAANMGISKRTLYEMFPDKETLLTECVIWRHNEENALMNRIYQEDSDALHVMFAVFMRHIEIYHQTNRAFFDDIKKYKKVYKFIEERRASHAENAVQFFMSGVKQGVFRSDVNYDITVMLLKKQFDLLLDTDIVSRYSVIDIYESIMFTYLRGITTSKGIDKLENFIEEYRAKASKKMS